jgi:iron-sulfur cluster assembly accessory protein
MTFTITRSAQRFMRLMLLADGQPGWGFRLAVKPGGCSGLSAEVAVAPVPAANEAALVVDGIPLFVNAESRILLDGVTIDFADTPASTGLVFHDPKQVACGSHAPASA